MKAILLLCACLCLYVSIHAQGSYSVSAASDRLYFCNPSQTMKVTGKVTSFTATTFNGFKYHFYYLVSGVYQEIGWYSVTFIGSSPFASYGNIQPSYFDGSLIGNPVQVLQGSNGLWVTVDVPYSSFPNNNTGQQLAMDVEAIDQYGSTTTLSSKVIYAVPLLYTNPVTLSSPTVSASSESVCSGATAQLSSNPNYATYGFSYDWYKDGAVYQLNDNTGTLTVSAPGSYYAIVSDACQSATSNTVVINQGTVPAKPTISSSNGTLLCNGVSTTLSTSPSAGGTINWNTGATGNNLTVSAAGNYYAYEVNNCGTGGNSNIITVATGVTPAAPSLTPAGALVLCDGNATTLNSSGTVPANILWFYNGSSTGHFGGNYTINSAGSYYTQEQSSCGTSPASNTVTVTTNNTPPAPALSVSGTILLCDGAGQVISASPSTTGGVIHWSTGATGNSITVYAAGNYYAWESNSSCGSGANSATVTITTLNKPAAPSVNPPSNQLLCNGASATLTSSGNNITWSNGVTGKTLVTGVAGTYYAYDNNACGNGGNSNAVVITTGNCPIPAPGTSFFICPGTLKTIDAGSGYESYSWNTGATTQTISVGPGSYTVTVMKNGCYATSTTVTVSYYSVGASFISTSGPTSFCSGGSVTLSSSTGSSFLWSTGATTSSIVVSTSGSYYVRVTDANGCQATSGTVTTTVNPLATASVSGSVTVCQNSAAPLVSFSASGGSAPYTFTYKINGGANQTITTTSGNSISLTVPTSVPGTFAYSLVSVQESSSTACINTASGNATIVVNPLPSATIAGSNTVCQNSSAPQIVFTGNGGTAPYSFTYTINGGSSQSVSTTSGNSIAINAPTNLSGIFVYALVSVKESSSTTCTNAASGSITVRVNPLPSATILGNNTVCQNSAQPQIIFTGSGGTKPYTFSYKINGGGVQTVNTTSGNAVAINVPTGTPGTFVYTLVSVQESSGTSCSSGVSGSATVVVNPLPTATIAGSNTVCQNSASSLITFTGSGGTAPYTFTFKMNGGANQTISTTSGNSVTISVPTNAAGTLIYSLVSVKESSSTTCSNTASGSTTVTVNPLPSATLTGTNTVCQSSAAPYLTFTGSGGTAPYGFSYSINGGAALAVTTTSGNSVTVSVPTNAAGTYTYALISVQDASSTACINSVTGSAIITVNPTPAAAILVAPNTHLCNGAQEQITISNFSTGYSYEWYLNGVFLRTTTIDTIMNAESGVFTVMAISDKGCKAAAVSNPITITTGTVAKPVITGYLKVCPGGKTKLFALPSDNPYEVWRWTDPPDKTILSTDSSFSALAGQYQVWVGAQGCYDSASVTVAADDTEFPAGRLQQSADTIDYGGQVLFVADVTGAENYSWDLGDGTIVKTSINQVSEHYYRSGDSLLVQLDAISERNCITHFTTYLKVKPQTKINRADGSFSGNLKDWNVFPIPFHDHLKVSVVLERKQDVSIDLFTADGKRVRSWVMRGVQGENLFMLDGVDQLKGKLMYYITAIYNNQKHFDKAYKY